ncbi:MAG TPA: metallophosphoesterase [Aggregatilineaceae bacterium]|nr:metallophosphoesterase [Aggregatilineaceae bacterium]
MTLTFVHISDSHLGPTRDFTLQGQPTFPNLERAVEVINQFPDPPDFVVHTGDVSNDRSRDSYVLAADILGRLKAPIYYVNGNHDDRGWMHEYLGAPLHASDDPNRPLDYVFEVKGERFMVVDAFDPAVRQPNGQLSGQQLEWIRAETTQDGPPLTVFMHYGALPMGSPWLDEYMLILNGEALHQALMPARKRLRGVFHGHLHRSSQVVRDGITYTCAGATSIQYAWRSWDEKPKVDPAFPPSYNLVQYAANQVQVLQYGF